jgi:hypothetical protein
MSNGAVPQKSNHKVGLFRTGQAPTAAAKELRCQALNGGSRDLINGARQLETIMSKPAISRICPITAATMILEKAGYISSPRTEHGIE